MEFATGPGKANHSWNKPIAKFLDRIKLWAWSTLGLRAAMVLYDVVIFSVLMFVAQ